MTGSDATIEANRPPPGEPEKPRAQIAALAPVSIPADADSGQPVDDPPPLIEPVGFDDDLPRAHTDSPRGERPQRRSFLAPLVDSSGFTAAAARPMPAPAPVSAPPAAPAPIAELRPAPPAAEIRAAPVEEAQSTQPPVFGRQVPMRLLALAQQWRSAAPAPSDFSWRSILYWGKWVLAAAIIIALLYLAGVGPFARSVPFQRSSVPLAAAPTDPAQRLAYFQNGAKAGNAEAELQLAILYAKGDGVTQDYATAAKWFRAAAEQGSARAQYDMGVLYERGRGVAADPEQAASWYLKAAEGKYPLAQYNLAVAYTKGLGIRKDMTEASLWYRRAAGQGVVQAMASLGTLYERGEGVTVSPVDAYAWYRAAGRRGNQVAARRAEDVFNGMSLLDQIRAEALASDVASSIHDMVPDSGATPTG